VEVAHLCGEAPFLPAETGEFVALGDHCVKDELEEPAPDRCGRVLPLAKERRRRSMRRCRSAMEAATVSTGQRGLRLLLPDKLSRDPDERVEAPLVAKKSCGPDRDDEADVRQPVVDRG
jgi:hypothetical protein